MAEPADADGVASPRESSPTRRTTAVRAADRILDGLWRHRRWLWVLAVVGLVLDGALTAYGLSVGLTEANPLVRSALATLGVAGGILAVKGVGLCLTAALYHAVSGRYAALAPAVLGTVWVAVGLANLATIAGA